MEMMFQFHLASNTRKKDLFPILFHDLIFHPSENSMQFPISVKLPGNNRAEYTFFFHGLAFNFLCFVEDDKFNCSLTINKELSGLKSEFYIRQNYRLSAFVHPKQARLVLQQSAIISKDKLPWIINDALKVAWSKALLGEKGFLKNNVLSVEILITDEDFGLNK